MRLQTEASPAARAWQRSFRPSVQLERSGEIRSTWLSPRPHTACVKADSTPPISRAEYESKSAGLIGRRLLDVRYWDIRYFNGEPRTWDYGDWQHPVMGVELLTDSGPCCVLWTSAFFCYGVEVFNTPMADHLDTTVNGPESWAVGGSDQWRDRLRTPVSGAQTHWERISVGPAYRDGVRVDEAYEADVPVALRIDFAAGPVWMVAGVPPDSGRQQVFIGGDEIMAVFAAERMRQFGFPDTSFLSPEVSRGRFSEGMR
jgi:hypothetical protein